MHYSIYLNTFKRCWDKNRCKARCSGSPNNLNPAPLGMHSPVPEVGFSVASRKLLQAMSCPSTSGARWLKVSTRFVSWYFGGLCLGQFAKFANCNNLEAVISRSFPQKPNFLPLLFFIHQNIHCRHRDMRIFSLIWKKPGSFPLERPKKKSFLGKYPVQFK